MTRERKIILFLKQGKTANDVEKEVLISLMENFKLNSVHPADSDNIEFFIENGYRYKYEEN